MNDTRASGTVARTSSCLFDPRLTTRYASQHHDPKHVRGLLSCLLALIASLFIRNNTTRAGLV